MKNFSRSLMKISALLICCLLVAGMVFTEEKLHAADRPNVLFIAVDDLNDWVGAFDGNIQMKTPHMDALVDEGAMVFSRAHCPAPVCCPSRTAIISGFMPSRSGIYRNQHYIFDSEIIQQHATLPEYFAQQGYTTLGMGKILHGPSLSYPVVQQYQPQSGSSQVNPDRLFSRNQGILNGKKVTGDPNAGGSEFSWGPTKEKLEDTRDYQTAKWTADMLQKDYDQPFFMAIGISKPHLAWYVPEEYFDMYDLDDVKIPDYRKDDLDDILTPAGKKKFEPSGDYKWVNQDQELFRRAVRAYMAASTYADECVGVMLDALRKSPHFDNTIVVIWGDHGWHLGEKMRFRKATLWSESTRVPLIIRLPGMQGKQVTKRVVNLIDLYPTLNELCGLPKKTNIDGRSFAPLFKNPDMKWDYPSLTTQGPDQHTVNDENWRYTRYIDGTEELYHMTGDPMEWTNLIHSKNSDALAAKKRLAKYMPTEHAASPRELNQEQRRANANKPNEQIRAKRLATDLK